MRENYRGMKYGLFFEYQNYEEKSSEKQAKKYQKTSALKEKESKRLSALEDKHYALYGPHRNALRAEINKELNKAKPNKDKITKLKAELVQTSFASAYSAGLYDD